MIIADNETAVDYLYYETVAKTVVKLISARGDEPLTIGLHGDWGAGKSSTLLMIEEAFHGDDRTLSVRFNGWLFEGYDDAKAVLIETIVAALLRKRSGVTKVMDKAADVLKSVNWFKVARTAGSAALTLATGLPTPDLLQGIGKIAENVIANPQSVLTGEMFGKVLDGAAEHFKASPEETTPQRMHTFRRDFVELLERADIDRLIVLIDDLDRCLPKTAIATLEAIRLFLFVPKAAFVIAADEGMIEYAVRNHFPDLPAATGPNSYARSYLEKLIQVPFRMPPLGAAETRVYLTLLLYLGNGTGPDSDEFKTVLGVAREALKRPWLDAGFDRAELGKKLTPLPQALDDALQVASEIAPILTEGTRGNPRQIKRFVNTVALRTAIAAERGFDSEIKQPILAKLMLAERFAPEVFEAIAFDARADGSPTMALLEAKGEDGAQDKKGAGKGSGAGAPDPFADWPNIEWARRWAAIKPDLTGKDLRPYVFVSRERRGAFSASSTDGPIETLIERLSSTTLAIRQVPKADLIALAPGDAERVFRSLVAKIDGMDSLQARPPAADGVAVLCEARADLREPLLGFLRRLPVSKVGGWVTTGWGQAVTGVIAQEYNDLLKQWAEQTENSALKTVARLALQSSKPKKK